MTKKDYFKSEKDFYEFCLLFTDGSQRMNFLGILPSHFSDKKIAERWYKNISEKIEDKKAIEKLEQIYSNMTD